MSLFIATSIGAINLTRAGGDDEDEIHELQTPEDLRGTETRIWGTIHFSYNGVRHHMEVGHVPADGHCSLYCLQALEYLKQDITLFRSQIASFIGQNPHISAILTEKTFQSANQMIADALFD